MISRQSVRSAVTAAARNELSYIAIRYTYTANYCY